MSHQMPWHRLESSYSALQIGINCIHTGLHTELSMKLKVQLQVLHCCKAEVSCSNVPYFQEPAWTLQAT